MAGVELATAYVTLTVDTAKIASQTGKQFNQIEKVAEATGRTAGARMSAAFKKADPLDTSGIVRKQRDLVAQVARTEEQIRQQKNRSAQTIEQANRKVQIAEARLEEARASGRAPASRILTLEDQLATARMRADSATTTAASAANKLNTQLTEQRAELSQLERQQKDAAASTDRLGGRFQAMGAKIASSFNNTQVGRAFGDMSRKGQGAADEIELAFGKAGSSSADSFGGRFTSGLKNTLGAAVAMIGAYIGAEQIGAAFTGAANLEQSQGALATVFKESIAQMTAWAQAADQTLGLTENTYNELATIIGSQLKNAGFSMDEVGGKTNDLISIGADFAAMFGGDTKTAVEAISSALKGERDPIERYGITLRQSAIDAKAAQMGFEKVGSTYDQTAQAAATLALITEQSGDAQGAFARESGTSANTLQKLTARFEEIRTELGKRLLPIFNSIGTWLLDEGIPAAEKFGAKVSDLYTNAVKPLIDWVIQHGDTITGVVVALAAGFAAFKIASIVVSIAAFISKIMAVTSVVGGLMPLLGGLVTMVGAIPLAIGAAVAAAVWFFTQTELGQKIIASVVDWFRNTAWPAMQWVFKAIGDAAVWLWEGVMIPAWNGIRVAIDAVAQWITGTAAPALSRAWDAVGLAVQWLNDKIIQPVWYAIRVAIAVAIAAVMTAIDAWVWVLENVLAPVFRWLNEKVIQPVWSAIRLAIAAVVDWFKDTVVPKFNNALNLIDYAFKALQYALEVVWAYIQYYVIQPFINWWQNVASPVISRVIDAVSSAFTRMKDGLARVWNAIQDTIIRPVVDWFDQTVKPKLTDATRGVSDAFKVMKDAVSSAWQGIKDAAKAPIRFVIETVVNKGIIDNFNAIAGTFGVGKINNVRLPAGFARGGILPGSSSWRDGDDQLVTMRRGEGVMISEVLRDPFERARLLYMNRKVRQGDSPGQARQSMPGFAKGGILDRLSSFKGDVWDYIKSGVGFASDVLSDPEKAFQVVVQSLTGQTPGKSSPFRDLAIGVPKKIASSVADKLKQAFSAVGGGGAPGAPGAPSAGNSGPLGGSWRSLWAAIGPTATAMGLRMTSNYRPGARTAGYGNASRHSLGKAVDIAGPASAMANYTRWLDRTWGPRLYELIYSPLNGQATRYRGNRYTERNRRTIADHFNHVHASVYDTGGMLEPGQAGVNKGTKPEAVLDPRETEAFLKFVDAISRDNTPLSPSEIYQIYVSIDPKDLEGLRTVEDFISMLNTRKRMYQGVN